MTAPRELSQLGLGDRERKTALQINNTEPSERTQLAEKNNYIEH